MKYCEKHGVKSTNITLTYQEAGAFLNLTHNISLATFFFLFMSQEFGTFKFGFDRQGHQKINCGQPTTKLSSLFSEEAFAAVKRDRKVIKWWA